MADAPRAGGGASFGGAFVLSLDFELMWGVRDHRRIEDYGANVLGAREVIPRLLDLFAAHGIACTWATVGMLFFDGRDALVEALPEVRPRYAEPRLSPYGDLDRLGARESEDPHHFAPSLIRRISEAPRQEIGTHTFSHFYCLEPGATREAFRADLAAARAAAHNFGLTLRSIVFPRNQVAPGWLQECREAGLIAFRGTERGALYRPSGRAGQGIVRRGLRLADSYLDLTGANVSWPARTEGMVNVPASRFLRPWSRQLATLEPLRLRRMLSAMREAARQGASSISGSTPTTSAATRRRTSRCSRASSARPAASPKPTAGPPSPWPRWPSG